MATGTTSLSSFVAAANVPEDVSDRVRPALVDTLAVAVAGANTPESDRLHAWAAGFAGQTPNGVTSWSRGTQWSGDVGVLINGADAHVLDYDDSNGILRLHPSAVMLPALLAMAERRDLSLAAVADAAVVGYETMSVLAERHLDAQYRRGWHITTTIGALGAVVACGRLLALDAAAIEAAIGLCGAGLGAVRANFGTSAKSYQVGVASANAYRAALLAEAGADSGDVLDHASPTGITTVYGGDQRGLDIPDGTSWAFATNPPKLKHLPTCFATHHAVAAAQSIRDRVNADDIVRIQVTTSATGLVPLIDHPPTTPTQARFSMPYVIACTMREGAPGLDAFTAAGFASRSQDPLTKKVFAHEDSGNGTDRWATVRVSTATSDHEARADCLGDTSDDVTLQRKVADCLAFGNATGLTAGEFVALFERHWDRPARELTRAIRSTL